MPQVDYFTGEPHPVSNMNVPKDALIIGETHFMSGEIDYTYYCLEYNPPHPKYGRWALWKVCDWVGSVPSLTCFATIEKEGVSLPPQYFQPEEE